MRRWWVAVALLVASATAHAATATISGTVFADENKDGVFSSGDTPQVGVTVAWETAVFAVTDAQGHYSITVPSDGIIWVRTPDGFVPSPVWHAITVADGDQAQIDLPLTRASATGPLQFIATSDSHIGIPEVPMADNRFALQQAAALTPAPHFLVITGDMTQGNQPDQFQFLKDTAATLPIPFVPVIGNHDRYDDGTTYRQFLGPPQYSFDQGGMHFIVLDNAEIASDPIGEVDFVKADIARSPAGMPTVLFMHAPQPDALVAMFADAGVGFMFTGHWHYNRVIDHGAIKEYNTEPLTMGGMDYTPAGYRVATFDGHEFQVEHHNIVDEPVLRVMYPRDATACVPPGTLNVIVAAEAGAARPDVTVRVDGAADAPAAFSGGWTHTFSVDVSEGTHSIVASMSGHGLPQKTIQTTFCVAPTPIAPTSLPDWTELQGSPIHHGAIDTVVVPPMDTLWATTVGGVIRGGSPILSNGRLYVPVVDLGDSTTGGLVALDARTGAKLWEKRTGYAVHNAPAVDGNILVYGASNGVVYAVAADSGAPMWSYDLGAGLDSEVSWLYAAPSISDGHVYIGVQANFVSLDEQTGTPLWSVDPSPQGAWLGSYCAAGVGGGVVVAAFSRGIDGMVGWDQYTGHELWRIPRDPSGGEPTAVNTSVVIDGQTAYFGNSATGVYAIDLLNPKTATGSYEIWSRQLYDKGFDFGYGLPATPALAKNILVVPSHYNSVFGLDASSGAELWHTDASCSVVHPVHYAGASQHAWSSSPIVTGDIVWIGADDGILYALDLASGAPIWNVNLGAPIMSAPIPAGNMLFVGTLDGTIQALIHRDGAPMPDGTDLAQSTCGAALDDGTLVGGGGCACSIAPARAGVLAGGAALFAACAMFLFASRRRR